MALRTAALVAPHQRVNRFEAAQLRARVAADVAAADESARGWTGLGSELPPTRVRVVSRAGWVRANLIGLRGAFDPLADRLAGRHAAARFVGWQVGMLLGLLSTKVLGQYILPLGGPGQAQLVVVGPNLLELSRRLGPMADDVRRVVLIHELAHRLQFDGVPWLGDHLRGLLTRYLESARLDPGAVLEALSRLPDALRALREERSITPLVQAVLTEEQRAVVDEAQALMSLLEGHGNATMYSAHGFVRDPDRVREALERRHSDLFARLLTAVAGLDLKRRQYREGEAFVRTVVERVGTAGLNAAFTDPSSLPTLDEISAPESWLARVHGSG
ncbi:MAG: zinc-dependent metalloprotease [Actinomycetota bacterium]|nr:zinc-dependent metalloprotease [Actinomycetota bacterium]